MCDLSFWDLYSIPLVYLLVPLLYAAQQQHLMLQTAALQQQHLSSAQLQSLAAVQQVR